MILSIVATVWVASLPFLLRIAASFPMCGGPLSFDGNVVLIIKVNSGFAVGTVGFSGEHPCLSLVACV